MIKRLLNILIILGYTVTGTAQEYPLTLDSVYEVVLNNHPLVRQARLISLQGQQQLRLARGHFDPKLQLSWKRKDFKDIEYYNLLDASIKLPTWAGLTPEVGIRQNEGVYLNQENFISDATNNRQVYAGASLAVGQGLLIDQRRAMIRQGKIFQELTEAEQIGAINKILLKVAKDYWEWYYADQYYRIIEQGLVLAEDIYNRSVQSFQLGELAAMDTVQASVNLLERKAELLTARIMRYEKALVLSGHLWDDKGAPILLDEAVYPVLNENEVVQPEILEVLLEQAQDRHPDLLKLRFKQEMLNVDNRFAREQLKPELNLKYYMLDQPLTPAGEQSDISFSTNYSLGVDFAFPLFLRKERAKVQQTEFKIQENAFDLQFRTREIQNAINIQYVALVNIQEQVIQQEQIVDNYQTLVTAEQLNLINGESDLFKFNIQQDKLLSARSKLLKAQVKFQKELATLYWEAGVVNLGAL